MPHNNTQIIEMEARAREAEEQALACLQKALTTRGINADVRSHQHD